MTYPNILISAYACRPNQGSEPGVGWNLALEMIKYYNVWVITRENNRSAIEAELAKNSIPRLHVLYYDIPEWLGWWCKGQSKVQFHYYLWQIGLYFCVRKLHQEICFKVIHHTTYTRYCAPSFLVLLSVPFIWGPLGGGETAPLSFYKNFSLRGKCYEILRTVSRWQGEHDPFVKITAQRTAVALVTTPETSERLAKLGAKNIKTTVGSTGINQQELSQIQNYTFSSLDGPVRFLSLGRLLHWKGFHLGLSAFAAANLETCEYWIVGNGPEKQRLEALASQLGISQRVIFLGAIPRHEALQVLGKSSVLVHPSLHDFCPTVCLESMAAGKPLICLDLGGPATQVTEETGIKVPAHTPEQAIKGLADAMIRLACDSDLRIRMGQAGQQRIADYYRWETKGQFLKELYEQVLKG